MPQFNGDIIFLDASGQIIARNGDLTLRADDTGLRAVIIGSGRALRPEIDAYTFLGLDSARWERLYSVSGFMTYLSAGNLLVNGNSSTFVGGGVNLTDFATLTIGTTESLLVDGTATFTNNGSFNVQTTNPSFTNRPNITSVASPVATISDINQVRPVDSRTVSGSIVPDTDAVYPLGETNKRWSHLFSASGTITTFTAGTAIVANGFTSSDLAALNGGTFFGNQAAPSTDAIWSMGLQGLRFNSMYMVSGFIETINPRTSGTFTTMNGSFIPDRNNLRGLGSTGRAWAIIHAASGAYSALNVTGTLVAATGSFGDLIVSTTLNLNGDGFNINQTGQVNWEANSADIYFSNLNLIDFDVGAVYASSIDVSSATVNGTLSATSANFTNRPTVSSSGVAMQKENYYEIYGGRALSFANPATIVNFYTASNGSPLTPQDYYFIVNEDVQIRNYSIETTHLATSPSPWAIRLRINDQTNDHASGLFTWHPTSNTTHRSFGSLSGTQTIPAGTRCRFIIDANGGAGHNTAYGKIWLGVTVVSGLKRGPQV